MWFPFLQRQVMRTWSTELMCHLCKFYESMLKRTHHCRYFNLWCGPFISFHHKPLLPLPCLHSNALTTPCLQSPWHEPSQPLSDLSICHQWLRGLSISPSDILIGSCCSDMHEKCISLKWDWPVKDECRNTEIGLLISVFPCVSGNLMKGSPCLERTASWTASCPSIT